MAFDYTLFQKWSQGDALGCNNCWNYTDTATPIATLVAANFFDPVNEGNPSAVMQVGDLIWLVASDVLDGEFAQVTAITPHITVAVFNAVLGAGSVGTANIAANAITTALIADANVTTAKIAANAVDTTVLAKNTIQYAQVAMTAAQWNGMYAAPFVLIAAPGAGNLIVVDSCVLKMTFVAAQYAAGGAVALQYDTTVHGAGTLASATLAAATVNGYAASSNVSLAPLVTTSAITTTENKGLYISNQTGAFTTGDGTWHVSLAYRIIAA